MAGVAHAEAVNLGEERDVLVDREIAVQAESLREVAHRLRDVAVLLHRIAVEDPHGARIHLQQPAHQPDGGRLAGAVRTDQTEHLAVPAPTSSARARRRSSPYFFVTRSSEIAEP